MQLWKTTLLRRLSLWQELCCQYAWFLPVFEPKRLYDRLYCCKKLLLLDFFLYGKNFAENEIVRGVLEGPDFGKRWYLVRNWLGQIMKFDQVSSDLNVKISLGWDIFGSFWPCLDRVPVWFYLFLFVPFFLNNASEFEAIKIIISFNRLRVV